MVDYYEVLRVRTDATMEEIRAAYLRGANNRHPDKDKDPLAAERFTLLKLAYDTLRDPTRRAAHDAQRRACLSAARVSRIVGEVVEVAGAETEGLAVEVVRLGARSLSDWLKSKMKRS